MVEIKFLTSITKVKLIHLGYSRPRGDKASQALEDFEGALWQYMSRLGVRTLCNSLHQRHYGSRPMHWPVYMILVFVAGILCRIYAPSLV